MANTFGNEYNEVFSRPEYDTEEDKGRYQLYREADELFEMRPPRLPTRAEEDEYIDFLAEDFRSDRWATIRKVKLTPNPKRIPWKNKK